MNKPPRGLVGKRSVTSPPFFIMLEDWKYQAISVRKANSPGRGGIAKDRAHALRYSMSPTLGLYKQGIDTVGEI